MSRRILFLLIAAQAVVLHAPAFAATPASTQVDRAEAQRGLAAVGARTSDQPALRLEQQTREPSPSFRLGAALGAWRAAAAGLDYDLKTPSGDGGDDEAIGVDCYDERSSFAHLDASRQSFGLTPSQVTTAAGLADAGLSARLIARQQAGPPARCR